LTSALAGVDVLIVTLGVTALGLQHKLIAPAKAAGVKLFVPTEFSNIYTPDEVAAVPLLSGKHDVAKALKAHQIPTLLVYTGYWVEILGFQAFTGFNIAGAEVEVFGDDHPVTYSSLAYIGAALVQLLATGDVSKHAGRTIGVQELQITAKEVIAALERKNGSAPKVTRHSTEDLRAELKSVMAATHESFPRFGAIVKVKVATTGSGVGEDVFEVAGYKKKTVDDVVA